MHPTRPSRETSHEPDKPARGLNVFTGEHARSERNYGRFSRLLKVLAVAHMAAYPVLDEIGIVASNLPRAVEKAVGGRDAEKRAKELLAQYAKELESGEPVPVDLATLYLEQEREAVGVSQKAADAARKRFEEIVTKAAAMKEKGAPRAEVLGYILKQQGSYDDASSLMTDLLVRGKGECEARQRYVSSAFQRLYPEDVQAGKLRTESFRPWVDKQGIYHAGHVRVVVDQGERVEVLEGDAVSFDRKEEHAKITATESTTLAVTGFAAKEGLVNLDVESEVKPIDFVQQAKRVLGGKHTLEAARELIHDAAADNSVSAYPTGATTYGVEGVGTRDVDPRPVAGSYSPSHYDWDKAVELTLAQPRKELTMENVESAYNKWSGYFDLDKFDIKSAEVMAKLIDMRISKTANPPEHELHPFVIRSDQKLPVKLDWKGKGTFYINQATAIPEDLEYIPTRSLSLFEVETIPKNIGKVRWSPDARLSITVVGGGDIDPDAALATIGGSLSGGEISIHTSPMNKSAGRPILPQSSFENVRVRKLEVHGVLIYSFGTITAQEIFYFGEMEYGMFAEASVGYLYLEFPKNQNVNDLPLYNIETPDVPAAIAAISTLEVSGANYGSDAFSYVSLPVLISNVTGPIAPDTFRGADIDQLVLMDSPMNVFSRAIMSPLGTWSKAETPYLGPGVDWLVFVPLIDDLASYDERGRHAPSIGPTLRQQVELARSQGYIHPSIPVVVISGEQHAQLKERYGGFDKIPRSALLEADYLKGEFVRWDSKER